jgi:hypothetical protein
LIRAGSPPSSAIASRMAARSTTQGTPVKSWSTTRAGRKGTSKDAPEPGRQASRAFTSSSVTNPRPTLRSTFSTSTLSVYGSRGRSTPRASSR